MREPMDGPSHSFSRRQTEIIALLRETGRVAVEDLASLFEVSPQTIRRDLNEMSEARVITRCMAVQSSHPASRTWPTTRANLSPSCTND
jgi:DeoR/GlpR family transcriptional regulator of sugar metabolism